jgi:glycosyltransferase involved in cell wall biosynthesis
MYLKRISVDATISIVILAKNEQSNIRACIKSALWADEVILIDDYSVDETAKIARKYGVKVFKRKLKSDFSAQRNFGLSNVNNMWAFFLDADEVICLKLRKEILDKIKNDKFKGYFVTRRTVWKGRELKHGEWGKHKLLRLGQKNAGKWRRSVHEYWDIKESVGELNSPLFHNKNNIAEIINNIEAQSELHATENNKEGKRASLIKIVGMPAAKFVKNYILEMGFLDGIYGFLYALLMSLHSFLAWSELWLRQ